MIGINDGGVSLDTQLADACQPTVDPTTKKLQTLTCGGAHCGVFPNSNAAVAGLETAQTYGCTLLNIYACFTG